MYIYIYIHANIRDARCMSLSNILYPRLPEKIPTLGNCGGATRSNPDPFIGEIYYMYPMFDC